MSYLSTLTPAEVLILTNENATHSELLKITFIDLLLKQVLKNFEVERKPHVRDKARVYQYVCVGQNFDSYESQNHERIFLSAFVKDNSIEILFRNLVKIGYQKSGTLSDYKSDILKTPMMRKCFSQNIFQKLFNNYSLTAYGAELKRNVSAEIWELGNGLSGVNTIENQKAIELIKTIGANIFILVNVDYELLEQIDRDLGIEMNKHLSIDAGNGCSGCGSTFDNYSAAFDSGCSGGHGGDGDSGCGGDGCGGCGGCGGD